MMMLSDQVVSSAACVASWSHVVALWMTVLSIGRMINEAARRVPNYCFQSTHVGSKGMLWKFYNIPHKQGLVSLFA
jgi:hypothetical protein